MAQMIYKEREQTEKKKYFPFPLKFPILDSLQEKKGGGSLQKKKNKKWKI